MTDSRAAQICQELIRGGTTREQIDVGVYYTDTDRTFGNPVKRVHWETINNGVLEPQECYARAIREAEDDMRKYGRLLLLHRRNPNEGNWRALTRFKRRIDRQGELGKFKREIPFLYTDFNPFTRGDDKIFVRLLKKIQTAGAPPYLVSSPEGFVSFVRRLEAILTAPKNEGGFGVRPTPLSTHQKPTANNREQTAIQSLKSGIGDCSEFAFAYYGLYIMMHPTLEPLVISTTWDDEPRYDHVYIGLRQAVQGGKNVIIVDPAGQDNSVRLLHDNEVEITPLQLMTIYVKNTASNLRKGAGRENLIQTAFRYDPPIHRARR